MSALMLTVKQAAELAGVSPGLMYGWVGEGLLPHYRLGLAGSRGAIRIKREDLLAYIESLRHETQAPKSSRTKPVKLKHLHLA